MFRISRGTQAHPIGFPQAWRIPSPTTFRATGARPRRQPFHDAQLIAQVFLPFAAGYYLSYLFRTINALVAPRLVHDIGLGAVDLGLLTSVYFLTFAFMQLPLGILLDRYGPRRIQGALMVAAAVGSAIFSVGQSSLMLLLGRALIGLGVAGALMAGLKAVASSFPREKLPLLNGCFIMLGTLGAVTATAPGDVAVSIIGWRGLFLGLAAASVVVSVGIWTLVPDRMAPDVTPARGATPAPGLRAIYRDPQFLRIAPLSTCCISTAWAIQGLWATRWLSDVNHAGHARIVTHLLVMACTLSAGALLIGFVADRLRRIGVSTRSVFGCATLAMIAVEALIVFHAPIFSYVLWGAFGVFGSLTVLSYAMLGEAYPKESAGRANAALNLLHIGGAFLLQLLIGVVVACWPLDAMGRYPASAYEAAFAVPMLLQLAAWGWFAGPGSRSAQPRSFPPLTRTSEDAETRTA